MMGNLARTDDYEMPDVGAPLIPSGPQVSPGVGWANRLFDRLPGAVMGGLAQMVETPGALMKANPYPPGSEEAAFYDATKTATAAEWAPGMAMNMMGGGVAGTGKGGGVAVGSGPIRNIPETMKLPLSLVEHGESAMPGGGLFHPGSKDRIAQYSKEQWPPIEVMPPDAPGGKWMIYDGSHRYEAAKLRGDQFIDAIDTTPPKRGDTTLGSGATDKKMGAILAATDNQPQGIRAYHSSPHDFDRFDLSKIGTGEGAQSYGHGLYFAENPAVSGQGGQYWKQFLNKFGPDERLAAEFLQSKGFDRNAALASNEANIARLREFYKNSPAEAAPAIARLQKQSEEIASGAPVGPRTYEVNINADPAHMLDWDKPLSRQSDDTQKVLQSVMGPNWDQFRSAGASNAVKQGFIAPSAEGTSALLREAGIPGVKYLDEGSRNLPQGQILGAQQTPKGWVSSIRAAHPSNFNGGTVITKSMPFPDEAAALQWATEKTTAKPTHNFVVFDPSIVDIMKKYGIAGAAPAGMGALAAQDYYRNP